MNTVEIKGQYITLGQLLKKLGIVSSGGEVRDFLTNQEITVNEEQENRRGKKLYPKDIISLGEYGEIKLV